MIRTLVIGIPLPHVSFDNYSFVSAPSIAEYKQVVVEQAAVSGAVQEVIEGSAEHANFAGQPVVNGPASPKEFALKDLLLMRRREAERLLANGGTIVCFAHPDVEHGGVVGLGLWRRYDWLPPPAATSYGQLLLPTFGRTSAVLSQPDHPFAPYVETFADRVSYHAQVGDGDQCDAGVFIRSLGGVAVGAEARVQAGRVVFLPTIQKAAEERALLAETLFQCLERWQSTLHLATEDSLRTESPSNTPR